MSDPYPPTRGESGSPREKSETRSTSPDPSTLTTDALRREISSLAELLRADMNRLQDANLVRFSGIDDRFRITESQRIEQKEQVEKAVQAALLAQKEAVREQTAASEKSINKSETSTMEQSKQQYATITAELRAITDKISDISDRVRTIEATKAGSIEVRSNQRADTGSLFGVIGGIVGLLSFLVAVVILFMGQ